MNILLTVLLALCASGGQAKPVQKPASPGGVPRQNWNVLLVTIDTLRWDHVGYSGTSPVPTPEIDRLARESLLFRHAYSHNPITLAAHANVLTGVLPLWHGVSDNALFVLPADQLTMAKFLKQKGYATAAFIGAFPLASRFGLGRGFDLYDEEFAVRTKSDILLVERPASQVLLPARKWLSAQKGRWFAWVHLFDPHHPYQPPEPFRGRFANDPYSGEIAYVDAQLGELFSFLRERRLLDSTVIVFTADHGEALGEKGEKTHGYFAYNNTIRVPLFFRIPKRLPEAIDENASHVDIFPTLCEILGLEAPQGLQGESLLPFANGRTRSEKRIYFESLTPYYESSWAPLRGYVEGSAKFIDLPLPEFYDLASDAGETRNLASPREVESRRKALQSLLQKYGRGSSPIPQAALDTETMLKLRSLGYISSGGAQPRKREYGEKDDLKSMLPVYNLFQSALEDYQSGRQTDAIGKLQRVVDAAPSYAVAYSYLAGIQQERGEFGSAIAVLKRGLVKAPGSLLLLSKLGLALAEGGDAADAVRALRMCLEKDGTDPVTHNYLGLALFKLGDWEEAERQYLEALKCDPRYSAAENNLGNLWLARFGKERDPGMLRQAIARFRRAKELSPRMANARNGLASAYYRSGQTGQALAEWREAEKLFPGEFQIAYNLGLALLESGKPGDALDRFQRCQKLLGPAANDAQRRNLEKVIVEAKSKLGEE